MTRVLGADLGMTAHNPLAVALVETDTMVVLAYQVITGPKDAPWYVRLQAISLTLDDIVEAWRPQLCAWEEPPGVVHENTQTGERRINAQTLMKLSHVGGLVIAAAARHRLMGIPVTPAQVKQAVGLGPHASKADVMRAVALYLGVDVVKDVADAIAVVLAGEAVSRLGMLVAEAEGRG